MMETVRRKNQNIQNQEVILERSNHLQTTGQKRTRSISDTEKTYSALKKFSFYFETIQGIRCTGVLYMTLFNSADIMSSCGNIYEVMALVFIGT